MSPNPENIGMIAGMLTTLAFVPQAVSIWRSKKAEGISTPMYSMFILGIALWLAYGLMIGSFPVILYNGITLALAILILAMKLRFDRVGEQAIETNDDPVKVSKLP
jgi:MtN3 and saliva related transmembrane protein